MTARNRAPRRTVLHISRRISARDGVLWVHELECGHSEERKRPAPARTIGCLECAAELSTSISIARLLERPAPWDDPSASADLEAARIRATLARRLGVPHEAINVQVTQADQIAGAMIWLHAAALDNFLQQVAKPPDSV